MLEKENSSCCGCGIADDEPVEHADHQHQQYQHQHQQHQHQQHQHDETHTCANEKSNSCCDDTGGRTSLACCGDATAKASSCCDSVAVKEVSTCCEHAPEQAHSCAAHVAAKADACCGSAVGMAIPMSAAMVQYHIPEMDCATEQGQITRALESVAGINKLAFNLSARVLGVDAQASTHPQILTILQGLGFRPKQIAREQAHALENQSFWQSWGKLSVALAFALSAELISFLLPETRTVVAIEMILALVAIYLSGWGVIQKGLKSLSQFNLSINALMVVAVIGAFLIGEWPEAAMVMSLFALAEALEARAVDKARHAVQELLAMSPDTAMMQMPDGQWQEQGVNAIAIGSLIRVNPGQRIALDGTLVEGLSSVNQASLTGESLPVEKQAGDKVFAGTINQAGSFIMRSEALASDTSLAKIIHAVEQAQNQRAPTQRLIDRFAKYYTPSIFLFALAVMLLPPLLLDWTWMESLYKGLVLLVIACPCALVIAIPVTIVSSLANAAKIGLIIKGGVYLEQARLLSTIAFDKTGTITLGQPKLLDFIDLSQDLQESELVTTLVDNASGSSAMRVSRVRELTATLASSSDHPVSQAIAQGLALAVTPLAHVEQLSGRGIQAQIEGKNYSLINHRALIERGLNTPALEAQINALEREGKTISIFADDELALALCIVADTIKPHAAEAIQQLHARGVHTLMLSGDNPQTAQVIAQQAGIQEARGHLLPEDKLHFIQQLRQQSGPVAMVGDGMNDAPALAQADIGYAMGGVGSDIAMETADIVVMNDDLRSVVKSIDLSQKTHSVLWQNIALALGIKFVFLVLTLFSLTSMWMAVFADVGASLLVILNGMRMLAYRP